MTTGSFPHNFSSVYWIFTKLDHMIALWKGKNPIYFGVIRSRSLTINIIFFTVWYFIICILWCTHFLFSYIMEGTSCISMRLWCPLCNNPTFFVQAHWSNSPRRDNSLHSDILSWFQANQSALATKCSKYQLYSIWFDPIRALTYDLLHPRRAR